MDPELIYLLTGIGTGIIGNTIYDGIQHVRNLLPIKNAQKAVSKRWEGEFSQVQADSTTKTFTISFTLEANSKVITGTGEYLEMNEAVQIEVTGGFYRDDYLQLNYKNKGKTIFIHGLLILHWLNNPTTLKGKFVGVGRESSEIISGNIELTCSKATKA